MQLAVIAFTGHRPNKLNGYNKYHNFETLIILEHKILTSIILDNVDTFISGMAQGVDLWAAEIAINIRQKLHHVKLVSAIPFNGQENVWPPYAQQYWKQIKDKADTVHVVMEGGYTPYALQARNEWMVDRANEIIAVWDGTSGGTGNCVRYAQNKGVTVNVIPPVNKDFNVDTYLEQLTFMYDIIENRDMSQPYDTFLEELKETVKRRLT